MALRDCIFDGQHWVRSGRRYDTLEQAVSSGGGHKRWTEEQDRFLADNCAAMTAPHLGRAIGRSESAVTNRLHKLGLHTTSPKFAKGHIPWNRGAKGLQIGGRATQFRKGSKPHNTLHDGAVTIRRPGNRDNPKTRPYLYVRLSQGKWTPYHTQVWTAAHGPVPPKHIVVFRNGDTLDCRIENLELISLADNLERNRRKDKQNQCSKDLSDNYLAGRLAGGDRKLRRYIIEHRRDLIEIYRLNLQLKREIRKTNGNPPEET